MKLEAFISSERRSIVSGNPLPNTTNWCLRCNAAFYGLADMIVEVRVTFPTVKPQRGTVIMLGGGTGNDWYTDGSGTAPQSGKQVAQSFLDLGFLVIERKWDGEGWLGPLPGTFLDHSSRGAALLEWIREHYSGPYAVISNSGGAGELAYALAAWGVDWLSVAVVGSGPPFTLLQYAACNGIALPAWNTICNGLEVTYNLSGVMTCGTVSRVPIPGGILCNIFTGTPAEQAAGVEFVGGLYNYPTTKVHMLVAPQDCASGVFHSLRFYDIITSQKALSFPAGAVHWLPETLTGRNAIRTAVTAVL